MFAVSEKVTLVILYLMLSDENSVKITLCYTVTCHKHNTELLFFSFLSTRKCRSVTRPLENQSGSEQQMSHFVVVASNDMKDLQTGHGTGTFFFLLLNIQPYTTVTVQLSLTKLFQIYSGLQTRFGSSKKKVQVWRLFYVFALVFVLMKKHF